MGDYSKRTERRLRKGVDPEKVLQRLMAADKASNRAQEPDWHVAVAKAAEGYDSFDRDLRDTAQRLALHTAIAILKKNSAPYEFLDPLFDLSVDLEDHDHGLKVDRFASKCRADQGSPDSTLQWMARVYLVCMVETRYRLDGRVSYPKACKAVIEYINKELKKFKKLPKGASVGAVIGSRDVPDQLGAQKQDPMTRRINTLERYRKQFKKGMDGQAQRRYASMIQFIETCQDDGSQDAMAYLQHMYEYYFALALKRIIRAC